MLRAVDAKDSQGWQIVNEDGDVVGHATSRDGARAYVKHPDLQTLVGKVTMLPEFVPSSNGPPPGAEVVEGTVLSPEAEEYLQTGKVPERRTPEEIEADAAHATHERIKRTVRAVESLWLQLAGDLYAFHKGKMWAHLGYETFASYIADGELGMEERWAYKLLETYQQLVINRGVDPERLAGLAKTKVMAILPAVRRDQVSVEEALSDVEVLGKRDLETKYSGKATSTPGRPDTSTTIETDREPEYMQCPTCGSRVQRERVEP